MTAQLLKLLLRPQRAIERWLPARSQLRGVGYLVAGNLLKIGLGLLTSALIFRALGPGDVGRLTLTLSVVGLFSIVGEFGLRDAAVNYIARFLPTDAEKAYSVARTLLLSKVFLATLASGVTFFAAGVIAARFYPQAQIADLIRLGAFSLLADGLLGFALVILEAQQNFGAIGILSVLQASVRAGLILAFFLSKNLNLVALLALESVVPLAAFAYGLRLVPRSCVWLRRPLLEHLSLLFHFTQWIAVAALSSSIMLKLDVLLLSYYFVTAEVGLYAAALTLVNRLDVIKNAVLTTAFPEACRRTQCSDLRAYVFQSLRLTGAATLAVLPLFGVGGWLVVWLYGAAFRAAATAFYPLLAAFLIGLNVEPVAYVLYPLEQPCWIAFNDLAQLVLSLTANLILIPRFGITGAAWGVLLTRIAAALMVAGLVRHFLWRQPSA